VTARATFSSLASQNNFSSPSAESLKISLNIANNNFLYNHAGKNEDSSEITRGGMKRRANIISRDGGILMTVWQYLLFYWSLYEKEMKILFL